MKKAFVLIIACVFSAVTSLGQAQIIVAQDGSGNYTTVVDAIANANPGDEIRIVDQGTYSAVEYLITQSVSIVSDPAGATLSAASGAGTLVSIEGGDSVNFTGLIIDNSAGTGGIMTYTDLASGRHVIQDCTFQNGNVAEDAFFVAARLR